MATAHIIWIVTALWLAGISAVVGAAYSERLGSETQVLGLWFGGLIAVGVGLVLLMGSIRREEVRTDATASEVFEVVLTDADADRLRRIEGKARFLPTLLRTHPHPHVRRSAGHRGLQHRSGDSTPGVVEASVDDGTINS